MNKQTALKTFGVIVVGALGSALWDFSKPVLFWLWAITVAISSFGIQSLKDDLYVKAASFVGSSFSTSTIVEGLTVIMFVVGMAVMQVLSLNATSN